MKNGTFVAGYSPDSFIINNTKYILQSAAVVFTVPPKGGHAIAGLKCKDQYYLYDSNNFIAYERWNENIFNVFGEYKKVLLDDNVSYGRDMSNVRIDYMIYVDESKIQV